MDNPSAAIPIMLGNGAVVYVPATPGEDMEGLADMTGVNIPSIDEIKDVIEGTARSILEVIEKVAPQKATVEFGLKITGKPGKLTALLVDGAGEGTLNITLEWGK